MSARREVVLWVTQRATAAILAVCVVVHLATIIYAVRGGLSAAEILGRTRGSVLWGTFYVVFVMAAALHGAIGLRTIAAEWLGLRGAAAELAMTVIGVALAMIGLRAVVAVVAS
jgi:fumarate reductase subunit C